MHTPVATDTMCCLTLQTLLLQYHPMASFPSFTSFTSSAFGLRRPSPAEAGMCSSQSASEQNFSRGSIHSHGGCALASFSVVWDFWCDIGLGGRHG